MKSMTEQVRWINDVARYDLGRAWGMLDMFNEVHDLNCGLLSRRVVVSDVPKSNVAGFYANCHDLQTALEMGER